MDKQGPVVWDRELYSISCSRPNGKEKYNDVRLPTVQLC